MSSAFHSRICNGSFKSYNCVADLFLASKPFLSIKSLLNPKFPLESFLNTQVIFYYILVTKSGEVSYFGYAVQDFFLGGGGYGLPRLFHSFWAKSIVKWGEKGTSPRKTTWPPASKTWLVSCDQSEVRALKISGLNHSATRTAHKKIENYWKLIFRHMQVSHSSLFKYSFFLVLKLQPDWFLNHLSKWKSILPCLWCKRCVKWQLKALGNLILDGNLCSQDIVCIPFLFKYEAWNRLFTITWASSLDYGTFCPPLIHFSPSVNSFFKLACATIQWG